MRARAVIDRTRTTRQPYTVSLLAEVETENERYTQVATEFHDWPLHRVEVRDVRVVADCAAMVSVSLLVPMGKITRGSGEAADACGVGPFDPYKTKLTFIGRDEREFGPVDIIELDTPEFVRRYEITNDGIIVLNDFLPKAGVKFRHTTRLIKLDRSRPSADLFEEQSLSRTFGPQR